MGAIARLRFSFLKGKRTRGLDFCLYECINRAVKTKTSTRERLLEAGLEILREGGARSLTVRGLVRRAGENPGTFVYYFKTRGEFLKALLEKWYAPLFRDVRLKPEGGMLPLDALKASLERALRFSFDNAPLIAQLLADYAAGEQEVTSFAKTLPMRHPKVILEKIRAAQEAGALVAGDPVNMLMYLIGATGLPVILCRFLVGDAGPETELFQTVNMLAHDGDALNRRLAWALRGIEYSH